MLAFEVCVNGKKRCVAGIANDGVVSSMITWVAHTAKGEKPSRGEARLHVGGLDSVRDEHMDWLKRSLKAGDKVVIRIVEAQTADAPIKGSRRPADESKRSQKAYVRRMAKQFGWKIQTK